MLLNTTKFVLLPEGSGLNTVSCSSLILVLSRSFYSKMSLFICHLFEIKLVHVVDSVAGIVVIVVFMVGIVVVPVVVIIVAVGIVVIIIIVVFRT